jgi:galactokinase
MDPDRVATRVERLLSRLADLSGKAASEPRLVRAPGRVNLIGEHTDYNLGWVLPAAISVETWVASQPRVDRRVRLLSLQEQAAYELDLDAPGPARGEWGDYVAGVATTLAADGVALRGVDAVVDSDIPMGSGLSSSAALELAGAWTLSEGLPPASDAMRVAVLAQRAENEYVGVKCGLMDQFASANGRAGAALLLDCRSLEWRPVPLPSELTLVAIDTRSPRRLAASEYNARRKQCERGVALLARHHPNVRSLRDVTPQMLDEAAGLLDEETMRRCRHVVEENGRVLQAVAALEAGDLDDVGRLFAASHRSLAELYEVSSPELDALVEIAAAVPGVVGARMTGAGFGGCTVNLVRHSAVDALRASVTEHYPKRAGRAAGFYPVSAVDGAGVVG